MPDLSPLAPLNEEIPIGVPETNEEMGESELPWPTIHLSGPDEQRELRPPSQLAPAPIDRLAPPPDTAIETTDPLVSTGWETKDTTSASADFNGEVNYMPGLEGDSPTPVHYLTWLIRHTITPVMARLEQVDTAIITFMD